MTDGELFALALVIILGITLNILFQIYGRYLVRYELGDRSMDILLLSHRMLSFPYSAMTQVSTISSRRAMVTLRNIRLFNRTIGGAVVIDRVVGSPLLVTPDDPERFADSLRSRLN